MGKSNKYKTPSSESEILPNLLDLNNKHAIDESEAKGFINAEIFLMESLTSETYFDVSYILSIHKIALGHLYAFAGKLRTVNISKGGFIFPAAKFLPQIMEEFDRDIMQAISDKPSNKEHLIKDIAKVHAEFLFIHPFREGNGRTSRLLADLMAFKAGYNRLEFEKIENFGKMPDYIKAVQNAAEKDYSLMEQIIFFVFST